MKIGNKIFLSFLLILVVYITFFIARDYLLSATSDRLSGILALSGQNLILQDQIHSLDSLESEIDSYIVIGSEELKETIKDYPEKSSQKISALIESGEIIEKKLSIPSIPEAEYKEKFKTAFAELSENINSLIKINEQPGNEFALNNQILKIYESIDKLKGLGKELLDHTTSELQEILEGQQEAISRVTRLSLFVGIFIFIVVFFLSFLLSKNITKPIITLRDTVIEIGKGNLDVKIGVKTKDEIGELAKSFKQMVSDLQVTRIKLEEYSKTLEQKVQARTKEMEIKNMELEKMNKHMVGRELKMIELKNEIQKLKEELEKYKPST